MFKRDKPAAAPESLIGPSVTIRGDVEFAGGVHLEGRVLGNLRMVPDAEAALDIVENAVVEGEVRAQRASINGRIRGDVTVAGRLVLGPKAQIEGNVYYGTIEMAAGARITGKLLSSSAGPSGGQSLKSSSTHPSVQ